METRAVERLRAKTPEEAIIEQIGRDFNLAPFMARTQFEQRWRITSHHCDGAKGIRSGVEEAAYLSH